MISTVIKTSIWKIPILSRMCFLSIFPIFVVFKLAVARDGCLLDPVYHSPQAPIVLTNDFEYPLPVAFNKRLVYFQEGEKFWVTCPRGKFQREDLDPKGVLLECIKDTQVLDPKLNATIDFNEITCTTEDTIIRSLASIGFCKNNNKRRGFFNKVGPSAVQVLDMCFDTSIMVPLYIQYTTNSWLNKLPKYDAKDVLFHRLKLFPHSIRKYSFEEVFAEYEQDLKMLGLNFYLKSPLVAGPLVDKGDFFYPSQRDGTFLQLNYVFRFKSINDRNWKSVTESIQTFLAKNHDTDVYMMVGGLRTATLPNNNNEIIQVTFRQGEFHMPRWNWKLVYFSNSNTGVIFFVYNNPFVAKDVVDDEFKNDICIQDVLDKLDWVEEVDNMDASAGYTYACPLDPEQLIDDYLYERVYKFLRAGKINYKAN